MHSLFLVLRHGISCISAIGLLTLAMPVGPSNAQGYGEKRVALVIGNGRYLNPKISSLRSPMSDAAEVARVLRELNFDVTSIINGRKSDIDQGMRTFSAKLPGADIGLVFFSGHGFQTNRADSFHPVAHIVPVDFALGTADPLARAVSVDELLQLLDRSARVRIVLMDACRHDPQLLDAAQRFAHSPRAKALPPLKGFVPAAPTALRPGASTALGVLGTESQPAGAVIAYAAAPNRNALDGNDGLSPFTASLVRHIAKPGISLYEVMGKVVHDVQIATRRQQEPWNTIKLSGPVYLHSPPATPVAPPVPAATQPRRPPQTLILQ